MKHMIGIDLGGTNIVAGVVDSDGNIKSKFSVPTKPGGEDFEIIADMAKAAKEAVAASGLKMEDMSGIGIGSPGTADSENGILIYTNNINFRNTPMRKLLQEHIDLPVYISNDANCAVLGETASTGAAHGYNNVVMITLGTGLGGGIIINGRVYGGEYGAGAELGHMVVEIDGLQCTCGRKGCWEAYSSATGLIAMTVEAAKENPDSLINKMTENNPTRIGGRTAFDAAREGDKTALAVVDKYIKILAEGVINMINIFRPQIFLIGGGVSNEGENLLAPLREYLKQNVYGGEYIPLPPLERAKLGNDAGLLGAAMLVLQG